MLEELCKCEYTNSFKIESDFVADATWCNQCGWNIDIEDFPLSEDLKAELDQWTGQYKKISVNEHNLMGERLTEKVKKELGTEYKVVFIPDR